MSITAAFIGFLVNDPERRTTAAGKHWARFRCGNGAGDNIQWLQVAVFSESALAATADLKKADRVYVEGDLRLDRWQDGSGAEKCGLSIVASRIERPGIGKHRRRKTTVSVAAGTASSNHLRVPR